MPFFGGDFSSTLTAGAQGFLSQNVYHGGNGDGFPGPGLEVASAGADQSTSESWTRVVNAGGYFQEQVGYQDWAFLTVGARFDANSAFGSEFATATYPKVGLSVVPTDLFEWDNEMVSSLRLRAAWGQAGPPAGRLRQVHDLRSAAGRSRSGPRSGQPGQPGAQARGYRRNRDRSQCRALERPGGARLQLLHEGPPPTRSWPASSR